MDISTIAALAHTFFGKLIMFYMILIITVYTSMLLFAFFYIRRDIKVDKLYSAEESLEMIYSKPVSVLVPAYNEERGVIDTVHSLMTLHYPLFEIIIINDGSKDNTLRVVMEEFKMVPIKRTVKIDIPTNDILGLYESTIHPNILLIDKVNGGKADALNAGINVARYPYFCSIDGDSILDKSSLLRVMKPIISSDGEVIAAGGSVRIANGSDVQLGTVLKTTVPNSPIVIMQIIEYFRAFYMGRIALSRFNLVLIISGAFSVFSKQWVVDAGGYSRTTIGEDMELVVKLHRLLYDKKAKKKIVFVPDPVCWTEAPDNLKDLRTQRRRWHQGLFGSLMLHKGMLFNPKYKRIGMLSLPYFWLIEFLGPIIELLGYIYIIVSFLAGDIYIESAIIMTLLFLIYSTFLSVCSILLEAWSTSNYPRWRDIGKLLLFSLTETFWFRPITIFFRIEGIFYYLIRREEWGSLERKGLSKQQNDAANK